MFNKQEQPEQETTMQTEADIAAKVLIDHAKTIDFSKAVSFCFTKQTKLRLNENKIIRSYIVKQSGSYEIELDLNTQKDLTTRIVNWDLWNGRVIVTDLFFDNGSLSAQ